MGYPTQTAGGKPLFLYSASQQAQETKNLFLHGFGLHQKGHLAQAKTAYEQVLVRQPKHFDALHLLGVIASQSGNPVLAVDLMGRAIEINPCNAGVYSNRGNALQELRCWDEAVASYEKSIAINPVDADAFYNLGNALQKLKRLNEAVASYRKAIAIQPNFALAFNNCGNALKELGHLGEALASYDKAIALSPHYADVFYNRGNALKDCKRLEDAIASYDRAIAIDPVFSKALINRGNALQSLKQWDEALASYDRALAINPADAEALTNRGNALQELGCLDEALASYDKAIFAKSDHADAFGNRGHALQELKRLDEALESYSKAIAIQPHYAEAHWNESVCRLLRGDFEAGWPKYEGRWLRENCTEEPRNYPQPLWLGAEELNGKTILLYAEQGLGDTLQFIRYARDVASLGATVVLEAPGPLIPLFVDLEGVTAVIAKGNQLPAFDFHCPLMSLPLAFNTRMEDIKGSPYLRVPPDRLSSWTSRIGVSSSTRIGLVWSGSSIHKNDTKRSIKLSDFRHLLTESPDYFCLQREIREADRMELKSLPMVRTFEADLVDFADTAALVDLMEVVITVDTSVAHLAGSLGKEVWILLPHVPDWRWMLDRPDSPWYDSVTLFRQPERGDWASVIDTVARTLQGRLAISK